MNYTICPHCGGKLRAESIGWKCEKCQGFIDMQGNFHEHVEKPFMPPMTIADLIRNSDDEKMAQALAKIACPVCKLCVKSFNCNECWLEVLRQPAKED